MTGFLKKIKRSLTALLERMKIRRDVSAAFRHDRREFLANAGALNPRNPAAKIAEITMAYHVLAKGLTMPSRRIPFGVGAADRLERLLAEWDALDAEKPTADTQVEHARAVLAEYRRVHSVPSISSGLEPHFAKADFYAAVDAPFPVFAASRHVCRHFAGPVERERLERALALALTAPSACNRQHCRLHVIEDRSLRDRLFAMQGGTRGFGEAADKVIVVTADLSAIRWAWERHDAYVNGGIMTMNLAYALHHEKIAHCILHWSVSPANDRAAHALLSIPANEAIVQVFVCGEAPDEFDIAASPRRSPCEVVTWH